jgi:hypothetical protein
MATAALVIGILGLICTPISPLAIIFGGIGMARIPPGRPGRGSAIAGLITGIVGTVFMVVGFLWWMMLLAAKQNSSASPE